MPSLLAEDQNTNPLLHNAPVSQLPLNPNQKKLLVCKEIKNITDPTTSMLSSSKPTGGLSVKRKRPPMIQIPSVLQEIQLDKIKHSMDEDTKTLEYSETGVGVFSIKGKKKVMEDTHKILSGLNGDSKKGFFGVYDGHGGRKASDFVAENLHKNILAMLENSQGNLGKEDAIKAGYLKTDQEFLKQGLSSGSCCVTCLIDEKDMIVSNLGDCRAVLCRGGVAEALTKDHTARREDERKRIESKGGYVEINHGAWRIHGILSVSRSIGDIHLKDWVLAEPDTKILSLTPEMEFLVLASDGLWEKVGNQEAADIARRVYLAPNKRESACYVSKEDENQFVSQNTSPPLKKAKKYQFVSENTSPSLKMRQLTKQDQFASVNTTPPSKKTRRISKEEEAQFVSENTSPQSRIRKFSREDQFASENTSPPSKTRRISVVKRHNKFGTQSPSRGRINKYTSNVGLISACKELVNLALTRGSMDDITVMIIDLAHFCSIDK